MRWFLRQRSSELHGLEQGLLLFRGPDCHLPHGVDLEVKAFALQKVSTGTVG